MAESIRGRVLVLLGAAICAAGMWLYANRVLVPRQVADAAAHGIPRGNLSDLYSRWYGTRELLLRGRDPYSNEITREIQQGYYGRPLVPDSPGGQNFQQGFYYPVYIAFLLAPTMHLPFEAVREGFKILAVILLFVTMPVWLRLMHWPADFWAQSSVALLALGSVPFMQGLKLQQMTLVVVPLIGIAMWLMMLDWQVMAGVLLALGTIKPQMIWLVLIWLAIWTTADWRRRYRWLAGFAVTMVVLFIASETVLPHWLSHFLQAAGEYRSYTGTFSVMDKLIGTPWSRLLEVVALAAMIFICWRERSESADSEAFASTMSVVLATTVFVEPSYGPYNQVLLIPVLMLLWRERKAIWRRSRANRILLVLTVILIGWQCLSAVALASLSFILTPAGVERGSALPFWTPLLVPIVVAAAMLLAGWQRLNFRAVHPSLTS